MIELLYTAFMQLTDNTLKEFRLEGAPILLPGGEKRSYRIGNYVLKHINKDSEEYINWISDLMDTLPEKGFRISKPLKTKTGAWITQDGWTAWSFIEGNHQFEDNIPQTIEGIMSFHKALEAIPKPDFLTTANDPYNKADKYTFDEINIVINPQLENLVNSLQILKKPLISLSNQLIHGDLNPDNILLTENRPPAIIDLAPYWRPADFSLAVYAYWIGPYRNHPERLKYFKSIPQFDQLLLRAAIRMLVIMSELKNVRELDRYIHATEVGIMSL